MQTRQKIKLYLVLCMVSGVYTGHRATKSGVWSDWGDEQTPCQQPHTPEHGEIHLPNGTRYGAAVHYSCYVGYELRGTPYRMCSDNGVWEGVAPTCVKKCERGFYGKDCTESCGRCKLRPCSTMTGFCPDGCSAGYQGDRCSQSCRDGTYGMNCANTCSCVNVQPCNKVNGYCFCGIIEIPNGDHTHHVHGTIATVFYGCNTGFELFGEKTRTCNRSTGAWDHDVPKCVKTDSGTRMCPEETDNKGTIWTKARPDEKKARQCPYGFSGNVTRICGTDGSWMLPNYNCIRASVRDVHDLAATIVNNTTTAAVVSTLEKISSLATVTTNRNATLTAESQLTDGELNLLSESLDQLATALSNSPGVVNDDITDTFLESANSMIDNSHQDSWQALNSADGVGAVHVLSAVESFGEALGNSLNTSTKQKMTVVKTNLAIEVSKFSNDDVTFPSQDTSNEESDWTKSSKSNIRLEAASFKDPTVQYVTTAVMYRNLSEILPSKTTSDANTNKGNEIINGPILALSVAPHLTGMLDPPVHISFEHNNNQLAEPSCRFWLFKRGSKGYWSNQGCSVHFTNETYTICECKHLTNFAVLMSPFQEADMDSVGLQVVSMVGIGVSIFCLLATLAMHILLWKYLKSDRTVLLANLCVALVVSYILFLAGVDRTENSVVCAVIAACLHYIYLVVFCVMLAEGIEMAVTVLYVFKTKVSRIKWLLLLSWLLPAVIVGITLGVTKTEGFGNERFCWLSNVNGLIWAFVGPTLAIILFNIGCLILVLRAIFNSRTVEAKESSEKVKTGVRSLCVLLPVTGVSWILGMFYISEDFSFIQYIFAICNGSQGFFLFLFHCLLSPQVKKAFLLRKRKKYAVTSIGKTTTKSTSKTDHSLSDKETAQSYAEVYTNDRNDSDMEVTEKKESKLPNGDTVTYTENCRNGKAM